MTDKYFFPNIFVSIFSVGNNVHLLPTLFIFVKHFVRTLPVRIGDV